MSLLSLHPQFFLAVHADRTARYRSEAEAARLGRELARQHRLRPAVGRLLVRLGRRIAAEPSGGQPHASRHDAGRVVCVDGPH